MGCEFGFMPKIYTLVNLYVGNEEDDVRTNESEKEGPNEEELVVQAQSNEEVEAKRTKGGN